MSRSLVFARRRARFFDGMKEGVALLFATPEVAYSHDVHYRYRPDPDLFYLTGFTEPEAAWADSAARSVPARVAPRLPPEVPAPAPTAWSPRPWALDPLSPHSILL